MDVTFTGSKEIDLALKELGGRAITNVAAAGTRAAMSPVVNSARKNLKPNKRSGLLAKAQGLKVRRIRGNVFAVAGTRSGEKFSGKYEGKKVRPIAYSHLVELGTKHSAPVAFMRRAYDANKSRMLARLAERGAIQFKREVEKARRKAAAR